MKNAAARTVLFTGLAAVLVGCANTSSNTASDRQYPRAVEALASLMTGTFETASNDPDNTIRDRRVRLTGPDFDGEVWYYYQLNTGNDWTVYRQRIIELKTVADGAILQKTYSLNAPEQFVDAWDNPDLLASISRNDIKPFFNEGCEQRWTRSEKGGWQGYVDPATCKVYSERRKATIAIEAEARLDAQKYRQTERGFDNAGAQLFGGEPGEFIVLYRQ